MAKRASQIEANVFQFFTRNPRGGAAKAIDPKDVQDFNVYAREHGIGPILAHASYTLNPASPKEETRDFATRTMADDMLRLEHTPGNMYNLHPGGHGGQGIETGVDLVASMLNTVLKPEQSTLVLLETMAGKGSEIGGRFEELRAIVDKVDLRQHLGVCLDTCHVYDGGYDIVDDLDGVLTEFDKVVGLSRLKAVHLNDSKFGLGSKKDRHAKIGEGTIGLEGMRRIINHPALKDLPFYLETPNELEGYGEEIKLLKGMYKG